MTSTGPDALIFLQISQSTMSRDMSGRVEPIYRHLFEGEAQPGPAGLTLHNMKQNSGLRRRNAADCAARRGGAFGRALHHSDEPEGRHIGRLPARYPHRQGSCGALPLFQPIAATMAKPSTRPSSNSSTTSRSMIHLLRNCRCGLQAVPETRRHAQCGNQSFIINRLVTLWR